MGKYVKKKALTPDQYKRANKAMFIILTVCYILYMLVETKNFSVEGAKTFALVRCALYVIIVIAMVIARKLMGDKKICMIFFAVTFLIMYLLFVMNNGVSSLVLVFPALVGFMIYLNSNVVALGCLSSFLICAIRCFMFKSAGNIEWYNIANLITMGFVVCIYGSYKAIALLVDFSKEDQAVIEKEAKHREEVAVTVAGIVSKLDDDFHKVLDELDGINESMGVAHSAMDGIAGSSESTAEAVNKQAEMTGQIQEKLESTNETALSAKNTTENLKKVIVNGKQLADELEEQSVLVDRNTDRISGTVEQLVQNVQKVSGITEAILNISSQTNLLALNASIEAARAGEAGKGFAVVADEIRQLAEETKTSTEKITAIMNELISVTNETQAGIEESAQSIEVQRKKVQEVTGSFAEVEMGMFELEAGVESMNQEVEDVLEANKAIVDSIALLTAASQEVSAGTQMSKETIDGIFGSLNSFSSTVEGAFEELQILKKTAEV